MSASLRILISAGPTRESIDPVRFISNYSTGYMGVQLAREALRRGHAVEIVSGPVTEVFPSGARVVSVESSQEMERALRRRALRADVLIMAAAVADFRPARLAITKLPRRETVTLRLQATPDIVGRLPRRTRQLIVGFALETGRALMRAKHKLKAKRLDVLLAQRANGARGPFGRHPVDAWLLVRHRPGAGSHVDPEIVVDRLGLVSKQEIARALLDKIERLWYGQHGVTAS